MTHHPDWELSRRPPISALPGDEPAFRLVRERGVRLPTPVRTAGNARYLAHRVARAPGDLLAHVQRIHLHLDLGDADGLYAALVDLFIALGEGGRNLRTRLLRQTQAYLEPDARAALEYALDEPLEPRSALPPCATSVLSRGLVGEWHLVARVNDETPDSGGALEEADALLRDGHLEAATRTLESALLAEPTGGAVGALLLDIYRRSRDGQRFRKTCERLREAGQALPRDWLQLARELKEAQP